jgi:hypothetical protein
VIKTRQANKMDFSYIIYILILSEVSCLRVNIALSRTILKRGLSSLFIDVFCYQNVSSTGSMRESVNPAAKDINPGVSIAVFINHDIGWFFDATSNFRQILIHIMF